jgi:hypothetical protein
VGPVNSIRPASSSRISRPVGAVLLVDLEEGPAGIRRVQLQAPESVGLKFEGDANAQAGKPPPVHALIAGVGDHHVPAGAASSLEVTPRGRAGLDRLDDLEKLGADRQDGVAQPEPGHHGIPERDPQAEDGRQIVQHRVEVGGYQGDLLEP